MNDASMDSPSLPTQLMASMVSGFSASFCSLPFDLLKSRLRKNLKMIVRNRFHHLPVIRGWREIHWYRGLCDENFEDGE